MEKKKITLRWLNSIVPGNPAKYADADTRGLQVWVTKTAVNFYFVVKFRGQQHHQKIGRFPDMKLEESRAEVMDRLGGMANFGKIDAPSPRRQPTIGDAIDHYCASFTNPKTRICTISYLRVFDSWRDRKISDVMHSEVVKIHADMHDHPVMANHAVKCLATAISRIYKAIDIAEYTNPARDINFYKEYPRTRFLDERESPAIFQELEKMAKESLYRPQALALLMMIYTGQRKSNVLAMDFSEIRNGETWIIPHEKAKEDDDIVVPLNDFAKEIIHEIGGAPLPKSGPLFVRRGSRLKDVQKTMRACRERCGIENLHIHDLRRSLGSWMLMNGEDIAVVSRTLGHKTIAVTERVYAHLLPGKISSATQSAVAAMRKGKA